MWTFLVLLSSVQAFYLPGTAPTEYNTHEKIAITAGPLVSKNSESLLTYDIHSSALHWPAPSDGAHTQPATLGNILFGDRVVSTALSVQMLKNESCRLFGDPVVLTQNDTQWLHERIGERFVMTLMADGLPSAELLLAEKGDTFYSRGFALGAQNNGQSILNTHYKLIIQYHPRSNGKFRIVGFLVWPQSFSAQTSCHSEEAEPVILVDHTNTPQEVHVQYSYEVVWQESAVPWATRWDHYLKVFEPRIHWVALFNSVFITLILLSSAFALLRRTILSDIYQYKKLRTSGEFEEETGWKLVHSEVFRAPRYLSLLSILVGNGAQLVLMGLTTILFAVLGFVSPETRSMLGNVMLGFHALFGLCAGYIASIMYNSFGGQNWRWLAIINAIAFPLCASTFVFLLNLFLVLTNAANAMPLVNIARLVGFWLACNTPLSLLGSYAALKSGSIEAPTKQSIIPRQIPPQAWWLHPIPISLIGSFLPFLAGFTELYFVLQSMFGHRLFYAFGFVFVTFLSLITTIALSTILIVYLTLNHEDYRWHWKAFKIAGGFSLWVFIYGVWFAASRLKLDSATSVILYLGYLTLTSAFLWLFGGSIGFLSSYLIIRQLYISIRID